MPIHILVLDGQGLLSRLQPLANILAECVMAGASIGFMQPFNMAQATDYWSSEIRPEVEVGRRLLFVAEREGDCVGTVQLIMAMPPNQLHRCEIAKMMVHPRARRLGTGRALMQAALAHARASGKTLATLDTRRGDRAEPLYASVGFEVAGVIPDFAWDPAGQARHATTYMYSRL